MAAPPGLASTRRTRFVCISDTHNSTVKLPKGDVLVHAGDLTNQGTYAELARAVAWLEKADFECKIVIAGNHDITLDNAFYAQHGTSFHNQAPQSPGDCRALLESSPSITYLCHESATVRLKSKTGPHTEFTVFGSPFSPRNGTWAFSYGPSGNGSSASAPGTSLASDQTATVGERIWADIPPDADIVVTHTPPFLHCDWSAVHGRAMGCRGLRLALRRVQPLLAVCGHVHEGRGAQWVRWDATGDGASVECWDDPGRGTDNKRMSIVRVTSRPFNQVPGGPGAAAADHGDGRVTCIVNCAITATNYPHIGGKQLNKPIVVDMMLPVWDGP
ncbi:hypothetical protein SEUCBS139899_010584 [Sporothrix eucalyptigena]|uniref:Calcineurin-like phosphoesterase domain-containing protein n=1 Tax=Sporothrix eucalyptigena TaxID=1812306 RepID=A0ABP0CAC0_9PEZI